MLQFESFHDTNMQAAFNDHIISEVYANYSAVLEGSELAVLQANLMMTTCYYNITYSFHYIITL